jgi:hypothetical protein
MARNVSARSMESQMNVKDIFTVGLIGNSKLIKILRHFLNKKIKASIIAMELFKT